MDPKDVYRRTLDARADLGWGTMDFDRYPAISPRRTKATDFEEVLATVRARWPDAYAQGSTGSERTWKARVDGEERIVAHCWSRRNLMEWFWVRVADGFEDTLDADVPGLTPRQIGSMSAQERAESLDANRRRATGRR